MIKMFAFLQTYFSEQVRKFNFKDKSSYKNLKLKPNRLFKFNFKGFEFITSLLLLLGFMFLPVKTSLASANLNPKPKTISSSKLEVPKSSKSLNSKLAFDDHFKKREALYEASFRLVGAHFAIPVNLLKAIARQESGCQPLVINIKGRDYYPKTLAEALELCLEAERSNLSYDVGLMQINRYWIRKYGLPHELLLNPVNNIYTGGFILAQEIKRNGLTWKAIGHYHSHTPWRALDYAKKIRNHLLALTYS